MGSSFSNVLSQWLTQWLPPLIKITVLCQHVVRLVWFPSYWYCKQ